MLWNMSKRRVYKKWGHNYLKRKVQPLFKRNTLDFFYIFTFFVELLFMDRLIKSQYLHLFTHTTETNCKVTMCVFQTVNNDELIPSLIIIWPPIFFLRVRTFPKDSALLGRDTVRALMYYALKVWSDIAPLNFHEVAGSDADIQIDFTKADHNDGYPFDGPGGTVAHAFFPGERFTAGDTHFDDDEAWTFRSPGEK